MKIYNFIKMFLTTPSAITLTWCCGLFCVAAALYQRRVYNRKVSDHEYVASLKNGRFIKLTKVDDFCLGISGVTLSTVFQPTKNQSITQPHTWIRERVRAVLAANPWLAGRLCKTATGHNTPLMLWIPECGDSEDNFARCFNHIKVDDLDRAVHFPPPCIALTAPGQVCINKDVPLWKVTFITHTTSDNCALVVSMCHTIGDGDTYFTVLHMLSETGLGVHSLTPDRVHLEDVVQNINVYYPSFRMSRLSWILKIILVLPVIIWEKPNSICCKNIEIDPLWIKDEKQRSANAGTIVSTNDIITSYILRTRSPGVGFMMVNLRTRIPQFRAELAGNYIGQLALRPNDYATPAGVRNAHQGALLSLQNPPAPRQIFDYKDFLILTNWAGFFREMSLPGFCFKHQQVTNYNMTGMAYARAVPYYEKLSMLMRQRAGSVSIVNMFQDKKADYGLSEKVDTYTTLHEQK
jgi:hypothetical protein